MRKWLRILLLTALFPLFSCVGQKEDPEEFDPGIADNTDEPRGAYDGTVFYRRVIALGFTATWCQYCPNMSQAIEDASALRPGRIIPLAVHCMDELSMAESAPLASAFSVTDYPSLVLDLDHSTIFGGQDPARIVEYLDKALEEHPCGISAKSEVEGGILKLEVYVKAVKEASYTAVAAWVQDNIGVAYQAGYGPGYSCRAVLRGFLEPGTGGRALGSLEEGDEGMVVFSSAVPDIENPYLVVYILEAGKVVNALRLGTNETVEYEYEYEKTN